MGLRSLCPFLLWLPELRHPVTLRADLFAGLTGAIVVLPQGVAFATIAGMPPAYGLYSAIVPGIIAALFGSSNQMVTGPTTTASIVLYSSLSALAIPGSADFIRYALTLTFLIGVVQLLMGLLRLGVLVNFISHSVIVGFTAGAAVLIGATQLRHFFGIELPRGLHFHELLFAVADHLPDASWPAVLVGTATLVICVVARRQLPRVPYMIPALLAGGLLAAALGVVTDVKLVFVGAIDGSLPPLSAPDLSLTTLKDLAPAVLAVTLFALTEAVSISRSLGARSGQLINGNQEFIGQGLANLLGAFSSSYIATGSFNRSAVNYQAGARTPMASILASCMLVPLVLVLAPLFAFLPNAAMAAILFMVSWGLIDWHHIRTILRSSRSESVVLVVTIVATLLLELEFAILLGVLVSLVVYLRAAAHPQVIVRAPDPRLPRHRFNTGPELVECPQLKIVRIDDAIFFGSANYVAERLRVIALHSPQQKHLLLLVRAVSFVDIAGVDLLVGEARNRRDMGGQLYLHALTLAVRDALVRGGYMDEIGTDNLFETKNEAIEGVFNRLDHAICARCDRRIFRECASVPPERPAHLPAAAPGAPGLIGRG